MPDRAHDSPEGGEHRISRRSLLRGQLVRWAGGVAEQVPPAPSPPAEPARMSAAAERATAAVRAVWDRDGHEPLLRAIEPVAERVVALAQLAPDAQVLDVGAGDGNVALAAWRRGAAVTACDLAPGMVARGRARCPQATWSIADAQDLPYADGAFDAVLSAFGAALAPDALLVASELVRVTCPGAVVVLAAWLPDALADVAGIWSGPFSTRVEGAADPADWGREDVVRARLGGLLSELELATQTVALQEVEARYLLVRGRRPIPPA